MSITIASIGLATAQGSAAEILSGRPPAPPRDVPWPLHPRMQCRVCHPARVVRDNLEGTAGRVVAEALATCAKARGAAVLVATHDARLEPFATRRVPIVDGRLGEGRSPG